jgi:hypothetical protein
MRQAERRSEAHAGRGGRALLLTGYVPGRPLHTGADLLTDE